MKKLFFLLSIAACFISGCAQHTTDAYVYAPPRDLQDGLAVGTVQEVGIDPVVIAKGVEQIRRKKFREVHSMLIYKDGQLVVEEYFPGHDYEWEAPGHRGPWTVWDATTPHNVHSVTKSITSACIGLAVDKGFIRSVDQSIFDYLPDHQQYKSEGREEITIEHLLTMTSGLPWTDWVSRYSDTSNPVIAPWFSDKDPVSFTLEAPLRHPPGSHYSYYSGLHVVLGEVLRNATGKDINEFSKEYLFGPLGVDSVDWFLQYPNGVYEAGGSLRLTPRGLLKVGITYLNDGRWEGQQIISSEWVRKSAMKYGDFTIDVPGTDGKGLGYSYSWWTASFRVNGRPVAAYEAGGWGGQKMFVIPELNAVVVFTGSTYTEKTRIFKLMKRFVIPAFAADQRV